MASKSNGDSLRRDSIFLLRGAARLIQRDFERRSRSHGMNGAQWQVLASLIRWEGERQITLADKLEMAPIVLARIVDRLEEAGYVERRPDPEDRRARLLYLTDAAQPLIRQLREFGNETGDRAFDGYSQEDLHRLLGLLQKVCANLSDTYEVRTAAAVPEPREDKA